MNQPVVFRIVFSSFLLFFGSVLLHGEIATLPKPVVSALTFTGESDFPVRIEDHADSGMIRDAGINGGRMEAVEGDEFVRWTIDANLSFGYGRLDIDLNRNVILSDLALILDADLSPESDLIFQLFNGAGEGVAMDLFGEVQTNVSTVGTDTFIIPLSRYPEAERIVIRRLSGPVVFREVVLIPVLSAFENTFDFEKQMADALGEKLARSAIYSESEGRVGLGTVHVMPRLEAINEIGAAALGAAGYHRYTPLNSSSSGGLFIPTSGAVYDFAKRAKRLLSLQGKGNEIELFFTSSNGVHWFFPGEPGRHGRGFPKQAEFGLASIPMSLEKKLDFEEKNGFPIIEFPIARSAIEVLVHEENPLDNLTEWQLSAAFSAVGQAHIWGDLGLHEPEWVEQPIRTYAGDPSWGTSTVFRNLALKGNPWREDLDTGHDVVFAHGVELAVSRDRLGIGFATQRSRIHLVKPVALAPKGGGEPVKATEDSIYSGKYPLQRRLYAFVATRTIADASPEVQEWVNLILSDEGQTLMVRSNHLPLASEEVKAWRVFLGLD